MLSPGTRLTQTQIPSIAIYFYSDPQRIPTHSKIITIMIKAFEREQGKPRVSGFMTASCRQKDAGGKMRGCPRYWRRGGTAAWSMRHLCGSCRQEAPPPGLGVSEEAPWRRPVEVKWPRGFGTTEAIFSGEPCAPGRPRASFALQTGGRQPTCPSPLHQTLMDPKC